MMLYEKKYGYDDGADGSGKEAAYLRLASLTYPNQRARKRCQEPLFLAFLPVRAPGMVPDTFSSPEIDVALRV